MKIIIFGTGQIYNRWKNEISKLASEIEIIAFFDNGAKDTEIDGIPVVAPEEGITRNVDYVVISSSKYLREMREQLLELGVKKSNIISWNQFKAKIFKNKINIDEIMISETKRNVLIVTTSLDYNGGSIAVLYAAEALVKRGNSVYVAYDWASEKLISESKGKGFQFICDKSLPYIYEKDIAWIRKFDAVIVNVFQMMVSACEISKYLPVLWWIHEPSFLYKQVINEYKEYATNIDFDNINVQAVSSIPQTNFNKYYPNTIQETMPYGIPDMWDGIFCEREKNTTVYAIIGNVCNLKSQHVFLEAASLMASNEFNDCEFWIIGSVGNDGYSNQIKMLAEADRRVKIKGLLTREEVALAYNEIDVVVCASTEDCLPITMTEGMMFGKVCIASDGCGTKDLLESGKNGFVFPYGDAEKLADIMSWCGENPEQCKEIGKQARKVYEENFTLESFGKRLEKKLSETVE